MWQMGDVQTGGQSDGIRQVTVPLSWVAPALGSALCRRRTMALAVRPRAAKGARREPVPKESRREPVPSALIRTGVSRLGSLSLDRSASERGVGDMGDCSMVIWREAWHVGWPLEPVPCPSRPVPCPSPAPSRVRLTGANPEEKRSGTGFTSLSPGMGFEVE